MKPMVTQLRVLFNLKPFVDFNKYISFSFSIVVLFCIKLHRVSSVYSVVAFDYMYLQLTTFHFVVYCCKISNNINFINSERESL